jgi:hypothetical protein
MQAVKVIVCVLIGVLVTPIAAVLAIASAGAGHGHYEFARLFFPYSMLLTRLTGHTITDPLIALALAQFPLYGVAVGLAVSKGRAWWCAVALLAVAHAIAVVLCFSGMIFNFS